jgi:excisionase family DNA binding protein
MPENLSHTTHAQSAHTDKQEPSAPTEKRFEPLLDAEEAARLLRLHPGTLRSKARKKQIPAIQVGRRWRFRVSALNDWLEDIAS